MRQRSTWQSNGSVAPRQAATLRHADIYTMNQEHPQPSATEYESGDPDSWAETPVPAEKASVNAEYDGDHVKRNELGFGEFRDDTFKHKDSEKWGGPGKYDNARVSAERKAQAAEYIAKAILRTSSAKLVEDTAIELMALPDRSVAAIAKRMASVSPDALSVEAKHRRALACTKISYRLLGRIATEQSVEALAKEFMRVDDGSLKSIIKTLASAIHVAQQQQDEQQDEQGSKTSQEECDDEDCDDKPAKQGQQQQSQQQQSQEQVQQEQVQQQQAQQQQCISQEQEAGLNQNELGMLNQLIGQPGEEDDELSALFEGAAPTAPVPAAPVVPAVASSELEISFDDDEAEGSPIVASSIDDLFNDDPEVIAQREICAAQQQQSQREAGYQTQAIGRTASKGARKLGNVRSAASSAKTADEQLASIWESP